MKDINFDCDNGSTKSAVTTFEPRPCLWVSEPIAAFCLSECFRIAIDASDIKPGEHLIALKNELEIRKLAQKLISVGGEIKIYQLESAIENLLAGAGINAAPMILFGALPYKDWLKSRKGEPLDLEDAVALASSILEDTTISRTRRNIELEELRERCKVSSFDWNRYIADLEAEIHAAVDEKKQTDRHGRLRLEIKALLKEADPIAYEITKADIQSRYRLNSKALETIIRSVGNLAKEAEVEDLGLDELFDLPTENIEYVIPGKLPVGEAALLIADPKAGKTLLAYDAAFAVATGEDTFLGEQCKQGKVLIVQCDESKGTAKGRLLKRGFRREDAPNVRFMHKFSITQLGALETKLENFRPTLVIIDSLRRINAGREISENSAEFADTIYQLKELCSQYNAALILIHHSNKNADAVGVQKARGSSAITGATWGIWELAQIPKPDPNNKKKLIIDPKDPTRILSIIARDVEGQRLIIELNPENNHWIERGEQGADEEEIREQKNHSSKVVNLLQSAAPVGLEACEINEALDIGRGIYSILNRLLGQKIIGSRPSTKDRRRTVYFIETVTQDEGLVTPQKSENPPPPTLTDPNVIEYAESIPTSSFQSSITNRSQSITIDHNPSSAEVCDQTSNTEPVSDTEYSITPPHCGGGRVSEPDVIDSQLSHATRRLQCGGVESPDFDRDQVSDRIDQALDKLGWSIPQIRDYLISTYKKKSRKYLSDAELRDFLTYLEAHSAKLAQGEQAAAEEVAQGENLQPLKPGDRVVTPQGEGTVLFFNEACAEYNVRICDHPRYFKPSELGLIKNE